METVQKLKKKGKSDGEEEKAPVLIRNSTDLQRMKLEKLMKNPEKPVIIPERPKERGMPNVPDFVRNVMGSSAGAGSGEFHVYRHLRRKEFARQKYMQERAEKEKLQEEYHIKLQENKRRAEERTAKKRLKRLKKKQKQKKKIKCNENKTKLNESSSEISESSDEEKSVSSSADAGGSSTVQDFYNSAPSDSDYVGQKVDKLKETTDTVTDISNAGSGSISDCQVEITNTNNVPCVDKADRK
ncbi:unnamed protein product [Acanthoscelides obtectus]|uniref:PRKR-interacting protein 1 n=1 Tax=Acanthoscelides obtectus TaxID=200917 RepID=A0A9P0JSM7_ACAOB|nr:unnamed protein product [Acanthoscelides obtectus]CAK1633996.1 PRKR-interacting protein 1 homolog [Acanthoscelides obtectus]